MYFNHLNYPAAWRAEYSKYPQGLSILESLMQWIRQVDDMVDSHNANQTTINGFSVILDDFIAQYDTHLQDTVTETLTGWQLSGFLDELIDAALQTEIDNLAEQLTDKVDKNGNEQVTWGMLDQTTKTNITGGSTPVVGVDAVNTTNIVNGSVTPQKLSADVTNAINLVDNFKLSYGINLFNKNTVLVDTVLNAGGTTGAVIGWSTTDFIPTPPNMEISLNTPRFFAEFDTYKKFIPGTYRSDGADATITTNSKTSYIRETVLTTSVALAQIKLGALTQTRYPYTGKTIIKREDGLELTADNVANNRFEVKAGGKNLFDQSRSVKDKTIASNGTVVTAIGYMASDYTEVPQGNIIISNVRRVHAFDKYFEPIASSYLDLGSDTSNYVYAVGSNTKYIRFDYYDTTGKKAVQVEAGTIATQKMAYQNGLYADGLKVFDLKNDLSVIDSQNVTLKKLNVLSLFDGGWASNAGTVADDTVNVTYASKSLKLTTTGTGATEISKNIDVDISGDKVLFVKVYIPNITTISVLQVSFLNAALSGYYSFNLKNNTLKNGWNVISLLCKQLGPVTITDAEKVAIKQVYFRLVGTETTTVTLDMVGITNSAIKRGKVILTFDDQQDGVWLYAKPAMDKYGFRGSIYVIKDLVDASTFMTLDQLKTVYANGWDLATHGQVELTTLLTPEAISAELHSNYDYMIANGFNRSAKHYCTPAGKYNDMSLAEIKKLFLTHRTTEFRYNTLPIYDKYKIGNISGNEGDLTFLKTVADNTETSGAMTILNWHQIVASGATGNQATASVFSAFIDYLATKNVDVVTLSDVFNPMD